MKLLNLMVLMLVLGSSVGCKRLLEGQHVDAPTPTNRMDYTGFHAASDFQVDLSVAQPGSLKVYLAVNLHNGDLAVFNFPKGLIAVDLKDSRAALPLYDQVQPSITTPYAYYNYANPTLAVVFKNVPSQWSYVDAKTQQTVYVNIARYAYCIGINQ